MNQKLIANEPPNKSKPKPNGEMCTPLPSASKLSTEYVKPTEREREIRAQMSGHYVDGGDTYGRYWDY